MLILSLMVLLSGCVGQQSAETEPVEHTTQAEPTVPVTTVQQSSPDYQETTEEEYEEYRMGDVPVLPEACASLEGFIPYEWELLDSVELDFNADGHPDHVGILDRGSSESNYVWYPRILFAIYGSDNGYQLDFSDINLVRARGEGGVFGDPYVPMEGEGNTFTINAYGGSAWKWSEATTFEYRSNEWYLAEEYNRYGYGPITTSRRYDDYRTGFGTWWLNNSDFRNIDAMTADEEERFELEFQVKLDAAPTLSQASQCWWLASDRVTQTIIEIQAAPQLSFDASDIQLDLQSLYPMYGNENHILYRLRDLDQNEYLAVFDRAAGTLNIISEPNGFPYYSFYALSLYQDKIYYGEDVTKPLLVKQDEEIVERDESVYTQIVRMNLNGTDPEVIFRYDNDYVEGEVLEASLPRLSIYAYPGGGEIIVTLYIGQAPVRYYRMNLDGSNRQFIGELKGFFDPDDYLG